MRHSAITPAYVHVPHSYEYATSAARIAATGFTSTDIGKLAFELDTFKFFVLTAVTPTWLGVGFENPMTTLGDLIYGGAAGTPTRLGIATTAGYELAVSSGGIPYWRATSGGGGGASGSKTVVRFGVQDNQPPVSTYATVDTRNSIQVLEFDAALDEGVVFQGIMPEGADLATGLGVYIHWMADSAVAGTVVWQTAFEFLNHDTDSDSFGTAVTKGSTALATAGWPTSALITHSTAQIDGLTVGSPFRLRIRRLGSTAAADDMAGDAQLFAVEIRTL